MEAGAKRIYIPHKYGKIVNDKLTPFHTRPFCHHLSPSPCLHSTSHATPLSTVFHEDFLFLQDDPNIQTHRNNQTDCDNDLEHAHIDQTKYFDTLRRNLEH